LSLIEELLHFEFSLITLLVSFLLPGIFLSLHYRYWYLPARLRRGDYIVGFFAGALALAALVRLAFGFAVDSRDVQVLLFLHFLVGTFTLLMIRLFWRPPLKRPAVKQASAPKKNENPAPTIPTTTEIEMLSWDQIVVPESVRAELASVIELLKQPDLAAKYGIDAPRGILLEGPPGTGKTSIAKVIANTAGLSFFVLKSDQIISKWVGESEKNLSLLFESAKQHIPAVIFIDEVDSIGKARTAGGERWADNLLNHLLQLIDGISSTRGFYVIAATNRADTVDQALIRPGRLNKIIHIPLPDREARKRLFKLHLSRMNLAAEIDLWRLADLTDGCSGATIKAICDQAGIIALQHDSLKEEDQRSYKISSQDLLEALGHFSR